MTLAIGLNKQFLYPNVFNRCDILCNSLPINVTSDFTHCNPNRVINDVQ